MFPYLRRPDPAHFPPHPVYGKALLTTPHPQDSPIQPDRLLLNLDRISRQLHRSLYRLPTKSSSPHITPYPQDKGLLTRKCSEMTPPRKLLSMRKVLVRGRSEAVLKSGKQEVWVFRKVKAGKRSLHDEKLQSMLGSIEKSLAKA